MEQEQSFKTRIFSEAESLVKDFFPKKIADFDSMLLCEDFNLSNIFKLRESTENSFHSLLLRPECGEVASQNDFPCNEFIVQLVDKLKPEIVSLIEAVNTVKVWVMLLIPKIEDGNNFGVEVCFSCYCFLILANKNKHYMK